MKQTVCPHCARPLSTAESVTRDHVVPAAFGGCVTVPACKTCNDSLGSGLEARLLSPHSWLTLLSQAQGYTAGPLWGRTEDGRNTVSHFGNERHRARTPAVEVEDTDARHIRLAIKDPPRDAGAFIESTVKKYGATVEDAEIHSGKAPRGKFAFDMVLRVQDLRRMTAKVALCQGAQRWGDVFLLSDLAEWLRVVLDVSSEWPEGLREPRREEAHAGGEWPISEEDLRWAADQLHRLLPPILSRAHRGLPVVGHCPNPPYIITFIPADRGRATLLGCVMLGYVFPILGVELPLPSGVTSPVTVVEPPRNGILS